ncbi:DSBA oxidoreductase [Shewanella mangrovi]|uniref:Thiol:disulfide interchange protein DsbA n=1 Tax=Shewanella mangrovi TaxID=1515746 RepID=A0A094JBY0_9GAMM|nr:DsbA family protein [Shewanella mangrovi]KFZ37380.1 DSBA oxidoreductase [Shewanella mangrovi]
MLKPALAVLLLAGASVTAHATEFVEGKQYVQVADKASDTPKVTEYFSFYCPHCNMMSKKYITFIKAKIKPEIAFDDAHVDFMNSAIGTEVMRSLAVMKTLGLEKQLTPAMFTAIQGEDEHNHNHKSTIQSRDDIKQVFATAGVDAAQYDQIADSSETTDMINSWRQQQNTFSIDSIPTFIVNDKYRINLEEIKSIAELTELMDYLATEKPEKKSGGSVGWLFLAFAGMAAISRRRLS